MRIVSAKVKTTDSSLNLLRDSIYGKQVSHIQLLLTSVLT